MKKVPTIFIGSGLAIASLWAASSGNISRKEGAQKDVIRPNVPLVIIGEEPEEDVSETVKARTFMEKLLGWTSPSKPASSKVVADGNKKALEDEKVEKAPSTSVQNSSVVENPSSSSALEKDAPTPKPQSSDEGRNEAAAVVTTSESSFETFWSRLKNVFSSDPSPKARRAESFVDTHFAFIEEAPQNYSDPSQEVAAKAAPSSAVSSPNDPVQTPGLFSIWASSAAKGFSNVFGKNHRNEAAKEELCESTNIYVPGDASENIAESKVKTNSSDVTAEISTETPNLQNAASQMVSITASANSLESTELASEESTDSPEEMEPIDEADLAEDAVSPSSEHQESLLARFVAKIKNIFSGDSERNRRSPEETFNDTVFAFPDESPETIAQQTPSAEMPSVTVPAETIVQTPETIPAEAVVQTPAVVPAETIVQTPETAPAEAVAQTPETIPAETIVQTRRIEDNFVETTLTYPDGEEMSTELANKEPDSYIKSIYQYSSSRNLKNYLAKLFSRNKASVPSETSELSTTNPVAVVSSVAGEQRGPFKDAGQYEIEKHRTGLLLPLGEGNRLCTTDYPVQLILKKPALLSVDRRTEFQIQKILDIHELILSKGRIRLKLLDESGFWTIRGRDMSLNLMGNADVAVDATGDLITRIFILEGEAACMPSEGDKPFHLKAGEHLSIGLGDAHQSDISSSTRDFLVGFLTFSEVDAYAKKMMAAESYIKGGNLKWPSEDKEYSGVLCSHCGYAFGQQDKAFMYCPHCNKPLVSTKENPKNEPAIPNEPAVPAEAKPLTKISSNSAWILVAAQAPKPFGH